MKKEEKKQGERKNVEREEERKSKVIGEEKVGS